jgi:hypothetical protein
MGGKRDDPRSVVTVAYTAALAILAKRFGRKAYELPLHARTDSHVSWPHTVLNVVDHLNHKTLESRARMTQT